MNFSGARPRLGAACATWRAGIFHAFVHFAGLQPSLLFEVGTWYDRVA